ncbi:MULTISPECIES: energy transducer TonB family protein [Croceitalea]|uniref:Energy transducer TonB n=1 Tax=Croceitalea vernalis TaxID=3075599 RepID=A0ABU3BE48_9FLAO|nr:MULTISPECIES: energy transducer TonB [unclassified Croceitalea]MDT0538363.1 energy transducer TonB [Croceitalea sp. P059]MDT0620146.1 energy transducer TonB [Croceitalea sp. P007]
MNLNRKQLSLLITIFSMAIVLLLLYSIRLGGQQEEEYVIEMALADEDIEELLQEEEQRLEELKNNLDPIKSHMALNETAKPSIGEPEPLKTLEEIMEERQMSENTNDFLSNDSGYAASLKELAKKRKERKEQLGEKEAEKKEFTNALKDKRTSISFSLVDRNAYDLPPPIYTCLNGGKVVINIEVDKSGSVTEAYLNAKSSTTTDFCLIDNAIAYALKAQFSSGNKSQQKGTITYLFQSK